MIICVCGMIGAGKSEYSKKTKNVVSDFDDFGSKREQIEFTRDMEKKNNIVYHITCYPTNEELLFFKDYNVKYIWINTTINECKKNIYQRGRKRDMENIDDVLSANKRILGKYIHSDINFQIVNVFETNEKW